MLGTPDRPDVLLTRAEIAEALTAAGFRVKPKTLAAWACHAQGPPYRLFGRLPLYRWGECLAWAEGRLTAPRSRSAAIDEFVADNAHAPT